MGSHCISSPERATRKKRAELRQRRLPMIIWKDGKVREVPTSIVASHFAGRFVVAAAVSAATSAGRTLLACWPAKHASETAVIFQFFGIGE